MPPTLFVKDSDSLAEQIQREFPKARVVKALNKVDASSPATKVLRALGWKDIIEFDVQSGARGTEMWLPLWVGP